jgi:hypothetical protein
MVLSRALAGLSFAFGRFTREVGDSRTCVRRGSCTGVSFFYPAFRYPRIQRTSLTWPARLGLLSGLAGSTPGIWSTLRSVVPVRGWIGVFRRSSPLVGSRTLEPRLPAIFVGWRSRLMLRLQPCEKGATCRGCWSGPASGFVFRQRAVPEPSHLHAMVARATPALGFAPFGICGHRPVRLARRGRSIATECRTIDPRKTASGSYPLVGLRGRDWRSRRQWTWMPAKARALSRSIVPR